MNLFRTQEIEMKPIRYILNLLLWILLSSNHCRLVWAHVAKDFDDTILYKIEFDVPDFDSNPQLKEQVQTFYTHEHEKYECVIPNIQESKDEETNNNSNINPLVLLSQFFNKPSCSYRIEAYWSYEICHGYHVRQYHEEREGKDVNFEEYYLGKRTDKDLKKLEEEFEEKSKVGTIKYKTTKIDNINYPYFELLMTEGTVCDIINAPRTTSVRYVCYPHGKNEIYSFKETSSCNYEAIILTSTLCSFSAFHPEEYKEVPIKCYNSLTKPNKPLSMLRQELSDMQLPFHDFPIGKETNSVSATLTQTVNEDQRLVFLNRLGDDVHKLMLSLSKETVGLTSNLQGKPEATAANLPITSPVIDDLTPVLEFINGTSCITGGTGWWKYEFCYGKYVRQFHKDTNSETILFLGYFDLQAHRQWLQWNPDKKPTEQSRLIIHRYVKGSKCDSTGLPREVSVKLICVNNVKPTSVELYLTEPETCTYVLEVKSPMVCILMGHTDDYGLIDAEKLQKALNDRSTTATTTNDGNVKSNKLPIPEAAPVGVTL